LDRRKDKAARWSSCTLKIIKIEYFRGLSNPIGIKISNKVTDEQFLQLVQTLNPSNEEGKLLVIIRMGQANLSSRLNHLIDVKLKNKLNFLFVTDPMHGNTFETK
jgi:3-deoxy-7-phosphoheptulonate synthase